jgi:hypothetical protein
MYCTFYIHTYITLHSMDPKLAKMTDFRAVFPNLSGTVAPYQVSLILEIPSPKTVSSIEYRLWYIKGQSAKQHCCVD